MERVQEMREIEPRLQVRAQLHETSREVLESGNVSDLIVFVKEVFAFQVIESDEPTPESTKFAQMHCASDLYNTLSQQCPENRP
jgi:hypothetical protein